MPVTTTSSLSCARHRQSLCCCVHHRDLGASRGLHDLVEQQLTVVRLESAQEPPMRLEDAWRPVDEVAGTGVDTFVYGLSRDDGLFYPSRVGRQFGADRGAAETELSAYWRVTENMASLQARGLDPLQVLIDRAHDKSMEFVASLRMGATPGLEPSLSVANGGEGYANPQVVRHQLAVLAELSANYPVDALELDFSASPGGSSLCFPYGSGPQHAGVMTGFLREAASTARGHGVQIGVRCYPTEAMNRQMGLDITGWLREGLIDFCVPMLCVLRSIRSH